MSAATITSKGQLTLPKQVRDALGLQAGDRVDFVAALDGRYTLVPIKSSITHLKGCIPPPKKSVTIDAMRHAVSQRASQNDKNTRNTKS
jgi:antitoxin PrlF